MVSLVRQFGEESEIVVRPSESSTITNGSTECTHIHILIILRTIRGDTIIICIVVISVVAVIVVESIHIILVITLTKTCLNRIEKAHRERVRAFATEPRVIKRDAIVLIVDTIELGFNTQGLPLTLRHYSIHFRFKQILDSEVSEFKTERENDT